MTLDTTVQYSTLLKATKGSSNQQVNYAELKVKHVTYQLRLEDDTAKIKKATAARLRNLAFHPL